MEPLRPLCHVLMVSADVMGLPRLVAGLNAAAERCKRPCHLQAIGLTDPDEVAAAVLGDGLIQVVLIDCDSPGSAGLAPGADGRPVPSLDAAMSVTLARQIRQLRPELTLCLLVPDDALRRQVEALAGHGAAPWPVRPVLDGCLVRGEGEHASWFAALSDAVAAKVATPFFDQLQAYVALARDSWHTPGHAGGDSFLASPWVSDFHDFVGDRMLRADLSVSVPMLDSLLHPVGVIARAQELAASAFGARQTYFVTNGTSTANKVIIQSLLAPGDKLLLDRGCHKSVHHGVMLTGAWPVYLESSVHRRHGLAGPVPKARLLAALAVHPDAKALFLTSCTYDGLRYDLRPIVDAAHAAGIKVVVDEAWYGHACFHPELRPTALECGADYVTQSTHKVLSAFSQASMIHVNDPAFDEHRFRENFNMHASTSPQYALIASLDVARKQAVMEGFRLLDRALRFAAELRDSINATGRFRVLALDELVADEVRADGIRLDPTKLTVDIVASGYSADELRTILLDRFGIQIEKNTATTLTLLLGIGSTDRKVARLCEAMACLAGQAPPIRRTAPAPACMLDVPPFSRLVCRPRDAYCATGERLALLGASRQPNVELAGRVCCDQIVPYPPGIPVLVPGQVIEPAALHYLVHLLQTQTSIELHGLVRCGGEVGLRVLTGAERATLAASM